MSYEVSEALARERRAVCERCPFLKRTTVFNQPFNQCTECGCDVDEKVKSADPAVYCPRRYWRR